jgi:hypothetical protein
MTRLVAPENSTLYSKMQIYDGVSLKDSDPHARSLQEYRDAAGVDEGMAGVSTRFAFKILSKTFNYDTEEIAANPVHLLYILENEVIKEQYNKERQESYIGLIKGVLTDKYFDFVEKDIRKAFMESFGDMCQNVFETYFHYVNAWVQDQDYRDPANIERISRPASINTLQATKANTFPAPRKGAIIWNGIVKSDPLFADFESISEGTKVKWVAVKEPNKFGIGAISYNCEKWPVELNKYFTVDFDTQFYKTFRRPLEKIMECYGWGNIFDGNVESIRRFFKPKV